MLLPDLNSYVYSKDQVENMTMKSIRDYLQSDK